jgi:HSP20 family protein
MSAITRRGPLAPLSRLTGEVGDLFERFFGSLPLVGTQGWFPTLDISERDDALVVRAEMPGMKPEDFDISVQGATLTIRGEKREFHKDEKENAYHTERRYGEFRRDVTLGTEVEPEKVQAEYHEGVLTITLPKIKSIRPRKVHVKAA